MHLSSSIVQRATSQSACSTSSTPSTPAPFLLTPTVAHRSPAAAAAAAAAPASARRGAQKRQAPMVRSTPDGLQLASNIVSTGLLAAIGYQLLKQPEVSSSSSGEEHDTGRMEGRQSCMRCNGVGYEPCFCTKWSDGDVGCSTCSKSGYMRCRSCGGGGTLMPAYSPIKIDAREGR